MALIRLNAIDPNATNGFLREMTGKEVGTPPPLDDVNRLGEVSQGNFSYVSLNLASSLGFGFASVSDSKNRRVMTFDFASTATQADERDNGIDSWTYGAGYRIGIMAFDREASAQLGLGALAAKATLENTQILIQVLAFGMPGAPAIPLPGFARFDVEAYGKYVQWQTDVIEHVTGSKDRLRPVRIYAALSMDIEQYFHNSAPLRYALRRLQDRHTLKHALNKARENVIEHVAGHEAEVRAVYAHVTGIGRYLDEAGPVDDQPISDVAKAAAERLIQQYDSV